MSDEENYEKRKRKLLDEARVEEEHSREQFFAKFTSVLESVRGLLVELGKILETVNSNRRRHAVMMSALEAAQRNMQGTIGPGSDEDEDAAADSVARYALGVTNRLAPVAATAIEKEQSS